ncbi:hypothetical protein DL766_006617 [Monosporascus sp. MC13-8B]|uniref:polynucleotide adenylyltransferase n=1 Tax=Monosporascus cannonballus TaxID=155416 RepID=A0ABY0HFQ7_9PEZI|nr:hypothetical protein DL762_001856 [Monosporascus cannonballus]RYO98298.1 hypothetical protein DL763_002309 [Monosporascus cannonballus]RYP26707.1 hypothetical protein DL766_006617 [Monosporascus sp. MC13-8B]
MAYTSQDQYASLPSSASASLPPRPPPSRHNDDRRYPPSDRPPQRWHDGDRRPSGDHYNSREVAQGHRGSFSALRQPSNRDYAPRDRDDDRGRGRDNFRPPQGEFTFRAEGPPGFDPHRSFPQDGRGPGPDRYDSYLPSFELNTPRYLITRSGNEFHMGKASSNRGRYDDRRSDSYRPRDRQENGRPAGAGLSRRDRDRNQGRRPPRPFQRRPPPKASDRLLLHSTHDQEAELMLGDTTGRVTYRDLAELSDSDEAAMDISDGSGDDEDSGEPSSKRARTTTSAPERQQEAPKWSNPDPYTALPPPDETTRKKIGMVQLIRKARVEAESKKVAVAAEADFISCDFSDDNGGDKNDEGPPPPPPTSSLPPLPQVPPPHKQQGQQDQQTPPRQGTKKNPVDLTASTSLGNRKRTADDRIKLPHASLKPVRKMASTGSIVPDWRPVKTEPPCPWAVTDHSDTACMATRLHKEVVDFYEFVRPRDFEEHIRRQLVDNLRILVQKRWPDTDLYPFGSFMSGLYLPTADMDIAVCSRSFVEDDRPVYQAKSNLFQLRAWLSSQRVAFRNEIELITKAKVPLVKYADDATALKVDISIEKLDGHRAIQTFLDWKAKYPAMPILVSLIKHFLLMRGLNEPVNGGIGGFSVICLVVHLLDSLPQVQSGSMVPEHHLGELLMEFFDYYGNKLNYETVAIRMNPPGLVNKSRVSDIVYRNLDRFSILDPNNSQNDIAGGSANTATIVRHFSEAHAVLRERMSTLAGQRGLLLGPLLEGRYSNFTIQRDYLRKLASEGGLKTQKIKAPHASW